MENVLQKLMTNFVKSWDKKFKIFAAIFFCKNTCTETSDSIILRHVRIHYKLYKLHYAFLFYIFYTIFAFLYKFLSRKNSFCICAEKYFILIKRIIEVKIAKHVFLAADKIKRVCFIEEHLAHQKNLQK